MKYRNIKTGAIIETESKISGENWVKDEDSEDIDPEGAKKKPGRKKAGTS